MVLYDIFKSDIETANLYYCTTSYYIVSEYKLVLPKLILTDLIHYPNPDGGNLCQYPTKQSYALFTHDAR